MMDQLIIEETGSLVSPLNVCFLSGVVEYDNWFRKGCSHKSKPKMNFIRARADLILDISP